MAKNRSKKVISLSGADRRLTGNKKNGRFSTHLVQVSHNRITCCVKFFKKKFFVSDVTNVTYDTMWRHFLKKLTLTIVFFHRKALTRLIFVPSAVSTIAFCIIWNFKKIKNYSRLKAIPRVQRLHSIMGEKIWKN